MFISYTTHSDADLAARERLCDILGPLCRARTLDGDPWKVWVDDRSLHAGDDWNDRLTDALHDASLFVVVMSRKYLNSGFCMDTELPLMLERHVAEGVPVFGVWLDDVNRTLFVAKLAGGRVMSLQERQCLPRGPKGEGLLAVRQWVREDDAWNKVAVEIERAWPPAPEKGTPKPTRTPARAPASPNARFAPFLCDRRDPMEAVLNSLEGWNRRPLLIASEGRRDDCLSEWAERIVQHEFAGARPEFDRGEVQFADPVVLGWPTGALQPQRAWQRDLTRRYTGFNNSAVDALHAAQGKAPAFWVTELTTDTAAALAGLDGLIALLADWPERRPNALVVVAVHLVRPDGDKPSRLAMQFKRRLAEVELAGRVLLTPVPVASWGAAEDRLAGEGGFVVLPAVSWALPALAQRVVAWQDGRSDGAALELPFVQGAPARWPELLRGQALRWLSPTRPAEEDVAALLRQLRGLLGARGFGWLAACAAYPHLSLPLVEHLAAQLDAGAESADDARLREAQWLALAHLPWLRQGWMPDWLRAALLRELPVVQRERLGEVLRALLKQDGAGGLDMGRIATAYRRRWFTRLLRRGEPAGSPLRDVIYLGLLDGTIDQVLALDLDAKTAGRLRRKAEPAWRRPLLQGMAAVPVGAVMLWGVVLPYLRPAWVPGQTAVVSAKTPDMPAGTRFRDCKDDACPWMVVVPAGEFMMGSPEDEPARYSDESPQHRVRVAKFAMARFEVTQGQWKALMGSNPSDFKDCGDDCPVENVSWDDAQAYVKKLSEKTGQQYRLPSEAEWEYAARAKTTAAYAFGATLSASQANFSESKIGKTVAVGRYAANNFGLSDMHGNVWEWVQDCWHDTYANAPTNGEAWETECNEARRVLRGGSWDNFPRSLRSANRYRITPVNRDYDSGFRIARTFSL